VIQDLFQDHDQGQGKDQVYETEIQTKTQGHQDKLCKPSFETSPDQDQNSTS